MYSCLKIIPFPVSRFPSSLAPLNLLSAHFLPPSFLPPEHIIGIERMESRRFMGNTSVESDANATDVWFHVVDKGTGRLLSRNSPELEK